VRLEARTTKRLDNVLVLCFYISRPARQRGTSGGVWSWGGIARCEVRLKRPERARAVGRSEAPQGEELRSDAALSPGRHSPGELRVPRLPGSGTFQGVPPALAEASSVPSSRRVGPRGDALKAPHARSRSARPGIKAPPSAGCPGQGCARHLALGPGPAIRGVTHRRWIPAAPRAPNPRGGSCAADPSRRTPRSPLSSFRGPRTSRPSCLGPGEGREKEDACVEERPLHASRAGRQPFRSAV
jgi:hypothetical protein